MLDNGFTPAPDEIRKQEGLGITAAFLWGVVYRFCSMSRGICDASHQTIADEAGMSKRSVDTYMPLLVEAGYLIDRTPDVKHKPHTYDAIPAAIRLGIGKVKEQSETGVQILHTSGDGMQEMQTEPEKSPEGVQNLPSRYAKNADPGVQNLQPIKTKQTKQKDKEIENLFLYFCNRANIKPDSDIQEKNFVADITDLYLLADEQIDFAKELIDFGIELVDRDDNDYVLTKPSSIYQICKTEAGKRKRQNQRQKTNRQTNMQIEIEPAPDERPDYEILWESILDTLKLRMAGAVFSQNLTGTFVTEPPNGTWTIFAKSKNQMDILNHRLKKTIWTVIQERGIDVTDINFAIGKL